VSKRTIKAQTILEYLGILIVVVAVITLVTKGGIVSQGLGSGLKQIEQGLGGHLPESVDGTHTAEIINHTPESLGITVLDTQSYEGRTYFENKDLEGYYFHEGASDMASVPVNGTITESDMEALPKPEMVYP